LRIFRNKAFARFAWKAGIPDTALCQAIREAERGLVAAELGGGVIKQRIARPGQGKTTQDELPNASAANRGLDLRNRREIAV
jgi:hypothetical protein